MIEKSKLTHGNYYLLDGKPFKFTLPPSKKFTELGIYYREIEEIPLNEEWFYKLRPRLKEIFDLSFKEFGYIATLYRHEDDPYYSLVIDKTQFPIGYVNELQDVIRILFRQELDFLD